MQEKGKQKKSYGNAASSSEMITGRIPPQARDLEQAVLGVLMLEPGSIDAVSLILRPESFYAEAHQRVFSAMMHLHSKGQPVDLLTVVDQLRSHGELEVIGGAYYITKLTDGVVSGAPVENYARILQQKFIQREMIRVGAEIYNQGYDESQDVFDLLDKAEQGVLQIGNTSVQSTFVGMDSVLVKTLTKIGEWRKVGSNITGVPSGFPRLDHITRGWQPGNLIILAARPSVGKTALALKLARYAARNADRSVPVAIWSLEMDSDQLALRMLAAESEVVLHRLQTGRLDDRQMEDLHRDGVNRLAELPIFFDDEPNLTLPALRAKARRLKKKHNIGFILIDYLQLMSGNGNTREQEISGISRGLKNLAKELQVPIIALSQLSRALESRTGRRRIPQLSDLRESGAIEQDADLVMFLWGPEEEEIEKDAALANRRYIRIAKARDGMLTTLELEFDGKTQRFKEHQDDGRVNIASNLPAGNWKPLGTESELF